VAGTREIVFEDTSAEALRVIIVAMSMRQHFLPPSEHGSWNLTVEHTFEVLEFSKRIMMPYIGVRAALRAAKSNPRDARLLLGLILRSDMFDKTELEGEAEHWKWALDLAFRGAAEHIGAVSLLPEYGGLSNEKLDQIIAHVQDEAWSDERELVTAAYAKDADKLGATEVAANANGTSFRVERADDRGLALLARTDPTRAQVDHTALTVDFGGMAFVVMDLSLVAMERNGANLVCISQQAVPTNYREPCVRFPKCHLKRFEHGSPPTYKLMLKSRVTALHKQCLALVRHYAAVKGVSADSVSILHVWRHFSQLGSLKTSDTFARFLSKGFLQIICGQPTFFERLSFQELDSIISLDDFFWGKDVNILKAVIVWAMHTSREADSPMIGGLRAGDRVRVRPECEHAAWREADCDVVKVEASVVHVQRPRGEGAGSQSGQAYETLQVPAGHLYDVGQAGLIRLLKHVGLGSVPFTDLGSDLEVDQLLYALRIPYFKDIMDHMIDVQTGKGVPSRLTVRKSRSVAAVDPSNKAVHALLADIVRKSGKRIDELVKDKTQMSEDKMRLTFENGLMKEQIEQQAQRLRQRSEECAVQHLDSLPLEQLEALVADAKKRRETLLPAPTSRRPPTLLRAPPIRRLEMALDAAPATAVEAPSVSTDNISARCLQLPASSSYERRVDAGRPEGEDAAAGAHGRQKRATAEGAAKDAADAKRPRTQ
jgi:hypothetical protein